MIVMYRRVSTDEQANSGLGLTAQWDACAELADREGLSIDHDFVDDGLSGKTPIDKCPGLVQALGLLGKGDILLVAKRDRLARDVLKSKMLERLVEQRGARIVSVAGEGSSMGGDDELTSMILRTIVDMFAEYERMQTAVRTKTALRGKIARGERVGSVRYGFDLGPDGKTLVENPEEQEGLRRLLELRRTGYGHLNIARRLTEEGVPTKSGKPWNRGSVRRILERMEAA